MAADLHIHAMTNGVTLRDVEGDLSDPSNRAGDTPNIWIGEVSWLKAAMFEEGSEMFVPGPVQRIEELVGSGKPVLDEDLRDRILAAFDLPNTTNYAVAKKEDVALWLDRHMGCGLYTVSW